MQANGILHHILLRYNNKNGTLWPSRQHIALIKTDFPGLAALDSILYYWWSLRRASIVCQIKTSLIYCCSLLNDVFRMYTRTFLFTLKQKRMGWFLFFFLKKLVSSGSTTSTFDKAVSLKLLHEILFNQCDRKENLAHVVHTQRQISSRNDGVESSGADRRAAALPREITPKRNNKMINEVIARSRWHLRRVGDACLWQRERTLMTLVALFHCRGSR